MSDSNFVTSYSLCPLYCSMKIRPHKINFCRHKFNLRVCFGHSQIQKNYKSSRKKVGFSIQINFVGLGDLLRSAESFREMG